MSNWTKRSIAVGSLLVLCAAVALAVAFSGTPQSAYAQTAATATAPAPTATLQVPFFDQWVKSPHNDAEAVAFTDWDETEDKKVPVACAQCHSTPGYIDFLGADKSKVGSVEKAPAIGTTIQCIACHNETASKLTSVQFLSTVEDEEGKQQPVVVSGLGDEARCMVCHQGRATKTQVDARIALLKAEEAPDAVPAAVKDAQGNDVRLGFINIHYYAAAVTLYGSQVHGGYEYAGKAYDFKNDHVAGYDSCIGCHDPHTTEVKVQECSVCHTGKTTLASLKTIRMPQSSAQDYDGDGNVTEGMADEIKGLQEALYKGIQSYAKDVLKSGILYDVAAYPYFFADKDGDGKADKNDKDANISFSDWTPRLLKAAYNYHVSLKDPGAYAHGNKYIVQLLYDSIEDLNAKLTTKIDMTKMARDDAGHFAGNTEPFRHWDAEGGEVPGSCARCHAAGGLPQFISQGANVAMPASNGFQCSTCHVEGPDFPALLTVDTVPFPSGAKLGFGEAEPANLCLECHQGRESKVSVDKAIGKADLDAVSDTLRFRNVHYFAAGATLFGSEAQGIYEYEGKEYAGRNMHVETADTCIECHNAHELKIDPTTCFACHKGVESTEDIRMASVDDFDGDGDAEEGLAGEIETYQEALYKAMQAYTKDVLKSGLIYDANAYPYYFQDNDNDGKVDVDDKGANVGLTAFSPRLLKAAYNYQYSQKDPGAYAHNAKYVIQALYDSIEDLNSELTTKIDMKKMVRPE